MDQAVGTPYQSALQIVTKASGFLNLFKVNNPPGDQKVVIESTTSNPVGQELIRQLQSNQPFPKSLKLKFPKDFLKLLSDEKKTGTDILEGLVTGAAKLPVKLIIDILNGKDPLGDIFGLLAEIPDFFKEAAPASLQLPFIIVNQVEIALSVLPTIHMFKNTVNSVGKIEDALSQYFFTDDGYQTIDGDAIKRPDLSKVSTSDFATLKSLVSQKSAVDYVRNSVRITIDAGADAEYNLPTLFDQAYRKVWPGQPVQSPNKDRLIGWMKGFASMAESAATSAVEALILGAGAAQTNSVIGAAAGTAAGTMARKATQYVYLKELQ